LKLDANTKYASTSAELALQLLVTDYMAQRMPAWILTCALYQLILRLLAQ